MSVQQRRRYDPEFKRNTVLLTEEPDRSVRDVAENLGIAVDWLYQWRRQFRDKEEIALPGQGNLAFTSDQKRIQELEKKLKDTEMVCEITSVRLKKLRSSITKSIY